MAGLLSGEGPQTDERAVLWAVEKVPSAAFRDFFVIEDVRPCTQPGPSTNKHPVSIKQPRSQSAREALLQGDTCEPLAVGGRSFLRNRAPCIWHFLNGLWKSGFFNSLS